VQVDDKVMAAIKDAQLKRMHDELEAQRLN
jgi:hypothetical protein